MNRKGSIEAQWFIIFGILLVALTSIALFMRITSIMENEDFFYEYHGDQIAMLIESMSTTKNPTVAVYNLGELTIRELSLDKKSGENAILKYGDARQKYVLLPQNDNYQAVLADATGKILLEYDNDGFRITRIQDCPEDDEREINRIIHNPKGTVINSASAVYIVAKDRITECSLRKEFEETYERLDSDRLFTTINPSIGMVYGEETDAIITIFTNE